MILGPVSYLDCIVFCIFLAPQLVWHAGLFATISCALQALPFLVFQLPISFIYERVFLSRRKRSPFVQQASLFEDFVVRCVRYAFAHIPPKIGRIFFSKQVALPFLRYRMLRHGYLKSPFHWHEYQTDQFKGVWAIADPLKKPDFVLYYAHGGGFSMGSTWFYLEFLLAWVSLLMEAGHKNPAVFGLEYTLVPDARYPRQLDEAVHAYQHVLEMAGDPKIVCVGGDSAGASIMLSLLLSIAGTKSQQGQNGGLHHDAAIPSPEMAVLISPWAKLISSRHRDNKSDYLDARSLHRYGLQYAGEYVNITDPQVSPGCNQDLGWWLRAAPKKGFFIPYGEEEVFAPEIAALVDTLERAGVSVGKDVAEGGIHAWPVASLFLASSREKRLKGLRDIVAAIRKQDAREKTGISSTKKQR